MFKIGLYTMFTEKYLIYNVPEKAFSWNRHKNIVKMTLLDDVHTSTEVLRLKRINLQILIFCLAKHV